MKINCEIQPKGLNLNIDEKSFSLDFPEEVWKDYPDSLKKVFRDNYPFLKALHLPQMLGRKDALEFGTSYPLFKKQISDCMLNNISFCADVDGADTSEKIKDFMNLKLRFKDYEISYPEYSRELKEKAVVTMSFGKDSLLTYALAKEIGLEPQPVFMLDHAVKRENVYKKSAAERFLKEFGQEILSFDNEAGLIHDYRYWKLPRTELGYGHLLTEFWMGLMPFANHTYSKYLLYGNEKSCDDTYINKDGYKSYPVFDQSSEWMLELSKMAKSMTDSQMEVFSPIEPLYELAIVKILHKRYPEIGKYQMSCFPDENDFGKHHYWCEHCSKCARIFIFLKANGIDPKSVGFKTNMLTIENKHLFSCFGLDRKEGFSVGYDASGLGADEQLHAFHLAYKKKTNGPLMDTFKKELLPVAEEKEEEFHKLFYGIHSSKTIPRKFIGSLKSIFMEELDRD